MKILRIMTVTAFAVLLLIPIVFFNFTPDSVSEIDNRKLAVYGGRRFFGEF